MRPSPTDLDLTDPVPYTQWGYYGKVSGHSLDHQSGAVYSQEPSAMFVGGAHQVKVCESLMLHHQVANQLILAAFYSKQGYWLAMKSCLSVLRFWLEEIRNVSG